MKTLQHQVPNGQGSRLALFQTFDEERLVPGRRPVLIVPGYGMNSFIFSYHPGGLSLEGYLARQGFEVFRADLREQGEAIAVSEVSSNYALEDLALTDLRLVLDAVLAHSHTGASRVDLVGASLGGTLMFLLAVLLPESPLGSLVALGSPVRWVKVHPLVRALFSSPAFVGLVPMRGTRKLAAWALPRVTRHAPWLLSVYMNPTLTDTSAVAELVKTVEDPNRFINRQIARWIRDRDLVVGGVNISEGLAKLRQPLLCVLANSDGIVPPETARFPYEAIGSPVKRLLEVGTPKVAMAHADLFISREAEARVFEPLSSWLADPK